MHYNIIQYAGNELISNKYKKLDDVKDPDLDSSLWIEVNVDNREEVASQLVKFGISEKIIQKLLNPGENFRLQIVEDSVILEINIGYQDETIQSAFITFIVNRNSMITIAPEGLTFYSRISHLLESLAKKGKLIRQHIILYVFDQILDDDVLLSRQLIGQIDSYATRTIGKVFSGNVKELEKLKSMVIELEEILENQFTSFGLIPELELSLGSSALQKHIDRLSKGIEHLQRTIERSEDKLDHVYQMYLNDLHETTNKKLNTLTIVQAIFVPLTFIAGVYGMNFVNMPELDWHSGYFYALGLMFTVVVTELYIFYRNGWFK